MSLDDRTPVVVGVGRLTHRDANISLKDIIADAVKLAAADAAQAEGAASAADILAAVGVVACPGTFFTRSADFVCSKAGLPKVYPNLPASVAHGAGATNAKKFVYTFESGSSPQYLVNKYAEQIAQGVDDVVVVAGGEVLVTAKKMGAMGKRMKAQDADEVYAMLARWRHDRGVGPPSMVAVEPEVLMAMMPDPLERAAGVAMPVAGYPLYEQALRNQLGHSIEEHLEYVSKICEGMSEVAAAPENKEHAWFPYRQSAKTIRTPTDDNRWVGFPYTKKMNSMLYVDQSAACVLMSAGRARRFGIPEAQMVYLHGSGDAYEKLPPVRRKFLYRSEATRAAGERAFTMAGITPNQLSHVDLYTCFPIAAQAAAREFGLDSCDDGTRMTLTGGLMYGGGPGANTSMHGLAALVHKLRADQGSYGLVYANGGMMTKHSVGIYSTRPYGEAHGGAGWAREDPRTTQAAVDAMGGKDVAEDPRGRGVVETYTVMHAGAKPTTIAVMGDMLDGPDKGKRFVANMAVSEANLKLAFVEDLLGREGTVTPAAKAPIDPRTGRPLKAKKGARKKQAGASFEVDGMLAKL